MEALEQEVKETIKNYNLIEGKEKIAVALSGGKDSTSLLHILHKQGHNIHGLMIDLYLGEWSKQHKKNMEEYCKKHKIPLTIIDLRKELGKGICYIKMILKKKKGLSGCTVCGIIKKWMLNKEAKKIGAKKIATGHNLDDETQNVLINYLKGNIELGIKSAPMTGTPTKGFVQRIKPLYYSAEKDIKTYAKKQEFNILYDKCPCAQGTYRVKTRTKTEQLTTTQKKVIVKNFQETTKTLRQNKKTTIKTCQHCGEPTNNNTCNACKILLEL